MANKIQLKRSSVSGKVPTTTDVDLGELALNTYDGKLYTKKSDGTTETVVQLSVDSTVVKTTDSGTVTSAMIADGTIVNADVSASAAIAGTKISPDFGSQTITTTGVVSAAAGAAATPSIAFTGDENTGIYSPGADQLALSTNGTGRLFVDASGRVGLNVDAPVGPLDVVGTANAAQQVYFRNTNAGSTAYSIINVGNDTSSMAFRIITGSSTATAYGGANSTSLLNSQNSDLLFWTNNTEKLRITSAGLVGIGTSSPSTLLHVKGTNGELFRASIAPDAGVQQEFGYGFATGDNTHPAAYISAKEFDASDSRASLNFYTRGTNSDVAPDVRLTITDQGNVGIGTTSPERALHVVDALTTVATVESTGTSSLIRYTNSGGNNVYVGSSDGNNFIWNVGGSERARIDSSGRLLVGTTSAISTGSITPTLQNTGSTTQTASIGLNAFSTNAVIEPRINFTKSATATIGNHALVANGESLGSLRFFGSQSTIYCQAAAIECYVDGDPETAGDTTDMPGRIVLSTTLDGASSPTERLRITNDGVMCYDQAAPASYAAAATLVVGDLKNGLIQYTGAAATLTLPTGTLTEGGFSGVYTNMTFEWSVINTGSGTCTIGAGTGHTIVGAATVTAGASGRFASRRTAANTFVSYCLS